jgi:hypothetical protein
VVNNPRAGVSHLRLVKPQTLFTSIPLALAALACTTGAPRLAPDPVAPPFEDAAAASAPPPSPPAFGGHGCAHVGCQSGVRFAVHLKEKPSAITLDGTIRVCSGAQCADGKILAPAFGGGLATCSMSTPSGPLYVRCDVRDEWGGARLNVHVDGLDQTFVDGDPVSLRVVAGGRRVVDSVRRVTYSSFSPNGPRCSPTCRNADVELWPGSRSDVTCSNEMCDPVVRFTSTLPQNRDGAGKTVLTACKNGDCKTTEVMRLWSWDDVNDEPVPESQGGAGVVGIDGSNAAIQASSGSSGGAPYNVKIEFRGDPRTYKDGDVYAVEWRSLSGTVLLSETRTVTTYDESHPGGPGCSPVTCKSKVL